MHEKNVVPLPHHNADKDMTGKHRDKDRYSPSESVRQ